MRAESEIPFSVFVSMLGYLADQLYWQIEGRYRKQAGSAHRRDKRVPEALYAWGGGRGRCLGTYRSVKGLKLEKGTDIAGCTWLDPAVLFQEVVKDAGR